MSWISDVFNRDARSAFISAIVKVAVSFMGKVGKTLWEKVQYEVKIAEESDLSGPKKFEQVYTHVKDWLKDIHVRENLLRLLIESAVLKISYSTF